MIGTVRSHRTRPNMIRAIRSHGLRLSRPRPGYHHHCRDRNDHA
jgi:hypothetical protein